MKNYNHQQKIINADPIKRGLFLGTGSGKTFLSLQLARGSTLVICPKTIRDEKVWEREWKLLYNPFKDDFCKLFVLSKEDFKKQADLLPRFDTIIGDEAHTLAGIHPATYQKNYVKYPKTSQIYTKLVHYIAKTKPQRVYMLTATPMPNPMVVYGLGTILGYKWSYKDFRDMFYWEKARNIWLVKKGKTEKEKLAKIVNNIGEIGRLEDFFDVPEQTYKDHYVEATKEQNGLVKELQLEYPDPLVQLGKRHQLEQGIYNGENIKENKTKVIEQYLQEFKKVIVFARYTKQIEYYEEYFKGKYNTYTLTGKTKNRQLNFEEARESDECLFIVQSSISAGWELPDFPCMIFASESFSYVDREQAEGRILRANHLKKNLYITLICGQTDKKVRDNIANKEDFVEHMHAEKLLRNNKL